MSPSSSRLGAIYLAVCVKNVAVRVPILPRISTGPDIPDVVWVETIAQATVILIAAQPCVVFA